MPATALTPRNVHVDRLLTSISVAYVQSSDKFIADKVFPIVNVDKQSDRYMVYERASWFRSVAQERAPATESAGDTWKIDTSPTYYARKYAVHKDIPDELRSNYDLPGSLERDATEWVTHQILLKRELVWADTYFKTGVWTRERTGVAANPTGTQFLQFDQAGSTPFKVITEEKRRMAELTGYEPNVLVLGPYVFDALTQHADVLDRIKYTQRGVVTTDLLAGLFGVDRVLVPTAIFNAAKEGAAESMQFIFGKHALLAYAAPRPSILQPSAGYIFAWTGLEGAGAYGVRIKRFRKEELEADRIEGEAAYDVKLVAADLGTMLLNAVA